MRDIHPILPWSLSTFSDVVIDISNKGRNLSPLPLFHPSEPRAKSHHQSGRDLDSIGIAWQGAICRVCVAFGNLPHPHPYTQFVPSYKGVGVLKAFSSFVNLSPYPIFFLFFLIYFLYAYCCFPFLGTLG